MIDSKQFQGTIHRFIELYGDRTEAIGDEIHAGLAWIEETKFVLIGGGEAATLQPPSWRRISRLFALAQQLRRPVLLWDLPFQVTLTDVTATLLDRSAAQNSQLHLLKLPVPIIGVFDRLPLQSGFTAVDAAVRLPQQGENPQPQPAKGEDSPVLVKVTDSPSHLKSDILDLLSHLSTVPVERLVNQRLDGIRQAVVGIGKK